MTSRPDPLRIGGEFEFSPEAFRGRPRMELGARLGKRAGLWTDTGRSALLVAATAIRRGGGKARAWIPAFSCESLSQPFHQAGFELRYYASELEGAAPPQPAAGDTLVFIHYFGHRNRTMEAAARGYRAAGVRVIEDCVQASLAQGLGESGDFAVASYRKLLPVADGAVLLAGKPIDAGVALEAADESFVSARMLGKLMRGASADPQDFLPLLEGAENRLQERIVPRHLSWLSAWMLERLDWERAAERRRANWLELSKQLEAAGLGERVEPLFDALQEGEVPLGLPVRVAGGKRDTLRRHLVQQQVFCPVHWPLDHVPASEPFANERNLASCVLTLPVDQRMSAAHVARMVGALTSFFNQH